jgi:hypothetical protein
MPLDEIMLVGPADSGPITVAADETMFEISRTGGKSFEYRSGHEMFSVMPDTTAVVLEVKHDRLEVGILSGPWKGWAGWIAPDRVRKIKVVKSHSDGPQ